MVASLLKSWHVSDDCVFLSAVEMFQHHRGLPVSAGRADQSAGAGSCWGRLFDRGTERLHSCFVLLSSLLQMSLDQVDIMNMHLQLLSLSCCFSGLESEESFKNTRHLEGLDSHLPGTPSWFLFSSLNSLVSPS